MTWHKNDGAPFKRADGTWVEKGEVFDATQAEARQYAYKLRPHAPAVPSPASVADDDVPAVSDAAPEALETEAEEEHDAAPDE